MEKAELNCVGIEGESLVSRVLCECGKPIEVCSAHGNGLTRRIVQRFGTKRFKNEVGAYHVTELCRCLKQSFMERKHGHVETYNEVWSKQRGNALHRHVSYACDGWKELPIQLIIRLDNESIRVLGHVDLFDPDERELIELKSTRAVEWQNKKHLLPHGHHVLQLQSYYSIWTQCYRLPAERLSVAYMDDRFRFNPEAKERFIALLKEQFNRGVSYRGQRRKWDTVIEQKTNELGRFLIAKQLSLDFVEPAPKLERQDTHELRTKLLALTALQAKPAGIGKSTLHYLRKEVESEKPFRVYSGTREKLANLGGAT